MPLFYLRTNAYLIFFIAAILVCIPLSFYYGFANAFLNEIGMQGAASKMILGQISEGVFILAIPFLFNRIGVKKYVDDGYGGLDLTDIFVLHTEI